MITEEEVRKAAHFRFGGASDDHSAFRGVFIHGAMWAIVEIQAENERLRAKIEMITEEEILKKSAEMGIHPNSPFARRFVDGANWAIAKMKAENEYLRAALGRVIALHEKHGGDYTEYMYHTYQEIEKIKNELGKK